MNEKLKSSINAGRNASVKQLSETAAIIRYPRQELIDISGTEATDLLHRISTNDITSAQPGTAISTCFLTEKGRLKDVATLLIRGPGSVLVVPSPGNGAALLEWIDHFVIMEELTLRLVSSGFSTFSLSNPAYRRLSMSPAAALPEENRFLETDDGTIVIRRLKGAAEHLEVMVPTGSEKELALLRENPVAEDSAQARFLRILRGMPSLGKEITPAYNPYETGLEHLLNSRKGCYVGQEVIARLSTYDKVKRRLTGVLLTSFERKVPLEVLVNSEPAGIITSLSELPLGDRFPGLAIVRKDIQDGAEVSGTGDTEAFTGRLVALPFSVPSATLLDPDLPEEKRIQ